ncbi:MAG: leucine-rich repeat domain-containing protein [Tidjanibacter sp.]|nr:leucine-rich repeat domain-containing protein [Tidjanibacter sp.]
MKKFLISLVVAAAALFATSCVNELDEGIKGNATGVTFEISTPELTSRADLFFGDCAAEKKLLYAVYDVTEGGNIVAKISKTELDNALRISKDAPTTFTLDLIDGNSYAVLFWAVSDDYSGAFSIDWTSKKMKMNASPTANKESYDAFYSYITLDNVEGSISRSVVLERPFAQLNIGTSDFEEAKKANFDIDKIWSEVSLTNVPNVLDCTSGHTSVEGSAAITYSLDEMVVPTDYKFPVSGYNYLAMNYVLVGAEKSLANATVTTKDNTKAKTITNTYNNIPLARNFKTNVYGALLTNGSQFDVDVDNTWEGNLTITPMANEIWYTAPEKITPRSNAFDYATTTIVSNEWDSLTGSGVITFSKGITIIGSAFRDCSSLISITIPDSVTEIGWSAFNGCSSLESINIPDRVTKIGNSAFDGCKNLKSITIPNRVIEIGADAFFGCKSLKSINIPDGVISIGEYAFYGCKSLESINIPNGVTEISKAAFDGCSSLVSINIPDSVTTIDGSAFWNCSSLESINIPDSVTEIGNSAFRGCSSLKSINIGEGVTKISSSLFSACSSLESITIPDSVIEIGNSAFSYCSNLKSITIPDSVISIGNSAFVHCTSLKSINIPNSVTEIGSSAFQYCTSLESINIPNSVTSIGGFFYCSSLKNINIPDSVTEIRGSAFEGCTSLESINIPDGVTKIGCRAFYGCFSLANVYCKPTTPPTAEIRDILGWAAFDLNASGRKIYVPAESVDAYKTAEGWNWTSYANSIEGYNF